MKPVFTTEFEARNSVPVIYGYSVEVSPKPDLQLSNQDLNFLYKKFLEFDPWESDFSWPERFKEELQNMGWEFISPRKDLWKVLQILVDNGFEVQVNHGYYVIQENDL